MSEWLFSRITIISASDRLRIFRSFFAFKRPFLISVWIFNWPLPGAAWHAGCIHRELHVVDIQLFFGFCIFDRGFYFPFRALTANVIKLQCGRNKYAHMDRESINSYVGLKLTKRKRIFFTWIVGKEIMKMGHDNTHLVWGRK